MSSLPSLRYLALAPATFAVLSLGCFGQAFTDIVEETADCISAKLTVGAPYTSDSGRSSLYGQRLLAAEPRALPTGVVEGFLLESTVELAYLPPPGGSLEVASAEQICDTSEGTLYDVELETGDAEETRTLVIRGLNGDEDRIVIQIRRPATLELSAPDELYAGAASTVCAEVKAEDGTELYAERSIQWFAEGARLSATEGGCANVTPVANGAFNITVSLGGLARTFELTAS